MSEFKGTKGNWELCKDYDEMDNPVLSVTSNEGKIAYCYNLKLCCGIQERTNANAILISKAPEMLEMLELLQRMMDGQEDWDEVRSEIKQLIKEATEL